MPGPPGWFATTQLMPAISDEAKPAPVQSSTRTGTMTADFATP